MSLSSESMTLARFVQTVRETLGITQARLAEQTHLSPELIQDIENGLELFLSPAVRQKLARGLKVKPQTLKHFEKPPEAPPPVFSQEGRERYIEEIVHFPNAVYPCPQCGARLETRIFHRRDLEDNPLLEVKAHCSQCLFKL